MTEHTALTRRGFLAGCAAVTGSLVVVGAASAGSASAEEGVSSVANVQYGFLSDLSRCVGCENCVAACREANHLSEETANRRRVQVFMSSRSNNVYVSTSCMHCDDPNCLRVCPAGAISKGAAGIVSVNPDRCIGCKYCVQACPYEVPTYNNVSMDKCDCCLGAGVAPGDTPYCVQACIFDALKYGPVDELRAEAEARGLAPVPVGEACGPNCLLVGERG